MSIVARQWILLVIGLSAVVGAFFAPRIAQDPLYHLFADRNSLLMIPNALNVLSNVFLAWVGIDGLYRLLRQKSLLILHEIFQAYIGFFAALVLVALGSGYYHWSPGNQTLIWDRLPMTIATMSFFSILLAERISLSLAKRLFPFLIIAGIASIVYWHYSEQGGRGDLRPYALVQFLPVLLAPLMLLMFRSRYTRNADLWWFFAWYLISRVFELLDAVIYEWLVVLSGHSLKHIAASIGFLVFLRHLRYRQLHNP